MNTTVAPKSTPWTPRRKRLLLLISVLLAASIATALVLRAFNDNLVFFLTPSQVAQGQAKDKDSVRIGGLVQAGSIQRSAGAGKDLEVRFALTDMAHTVPVVYRGVLPDLFREGQGVVTEGKFDAAGVFVADSVLAKHDENYMPPEVAKSLKDKGVWQGNAADKAPDKAKR